MSKTRFVKGFQLTNANGDIDPASAGFRYITETLTYIRSKIIEQKFYEVPIADFLPVDVGEASWSDEIVQNLAFQTSGGFFDGDVDTAQGAARLATVDAALSPIRMPVRTWAKAAAWTVFEIEKAAAAGNWDVVATKMAALKKSWDLGIQQCAFLGHPSVAAITGLLNNPNVNIDTSLLPVHISAMTPAQFATFVGSVLEAYFNNTNATAMPDTLILPMSDFLGLGAPVSSTYPVNSMLSYLTDLFQRMTANDKFEIKGLAYADATRNAAYGLNKNRAVLYRRDPDTLSMSIPVDLTMLEADTSNKINWQQPAYGQYSGVLISRPREVYYIDEQA